MAKNSQGKTSFSKKIIIILLLAVVLGVSCIFSAQIDALIGIGNKGSNKAEAKTVFASDLIVNYINVGQGDSTYIELPNGETMLIDAGESGYGETVVNYIRSRQGLDETKEPVIDYLILTHSDSDHSGGMTDADEDEVITVLGDAEVKKIYRPFQLAMDGANYYQFEDLQSYGNIEDISKVDTATYRRFIKAIYSETYGLENTPAEVSVFYDGLVIGGQQEGFVFEFFAPDVLEDKTPFSLNANVHMTKGFPVKGYGDNKNNASPVMLLEYKEFSFVFTGDAEKEVEEDFLADLATEEKLRFSNIDVFQAGHHGSSTSNTASFMNLINPTYTVVSCGLNNKYGHPTDKFLKTLDSLNHRVDDYLIRTDLNGNIAFGVSNGVLIYVAGVEVEIGRVIHWYHIAIVLFVGLSIIIISIKFKKNGGVTKTSVRRGNSAAKKVVKKYFD